MKCAKCGKKFLKTALGWGYAYDGKYVCSYKCMRQMEKEDTSMTEQEKKEVDEMLAQGADKEQICTELGLSTQSVGVYLAHKRKKTEAQDAPEAVLETALEKAEKAVSGTNDAMKAELVRLMSDMVQLLKRII